MGRAFEYRKATKMKRWGNMARTFTRIGKQIAIAVKAGGPDAENNPHLRSCVANAKAANMPKENVERACDILDGKAYLIDIALHPHYINMLDMYDRLEVQKAKMMA